MRTPHDDARNRFIQFGCGEHALPSPWENYDREVDIRKSLPFADNSARFLFAEHVIDYVLFAECLYFLRECYRVLQPGGVLRVCFPDVARFTGHEFDDFEDEELRTQRVADYRMFLEAKGHRADLDGVFRYLLAGDGRRSSWTRELVEAALWACHFESMTAPDYGDSSLHELRGIDRRHFTVPESIAIAETTIIEATK